MNQNKSDVAPENTRAAIRSAIAEFLRSEGTLPTGKAIHAMVGRGSMTTVYQELEAWQREAASRLQLPEAPPGLGEAFQAMWAQAHQAAEAMFDRQRLELEAALTVQRKITEATQIDLEQSLAAGAELGQQLSALRSASELRERALEDGLLEAKTQLSEMNARLDGLKTENAQLHDALAKDRVRHEAETRRSEDRYAGLEKRMVVEVDQARQSVKGVQAELVEARTALATQKRELTEAVTRGQLLEQQITRMDAKQSHSDMEKQLLLADLAQAQQKEVEWLDKQGLWGKEREAVSQELMLTEERWRQAELRVVEHRVRLEVLLESQMQRASQDMST